MCTPDINEATTSPKLLQESNIALKEVLQIVHPILQQREPVHAHPEGESGDFLRVISVVLHKLKHVRIHHAAAQHFNPSRLLARTARSIIRPTLPASAANETCDVKLRAGLSERKERRPEVRFHRRPEQRLHGVIERALQITERNVGVDGEAFDLM